MKQMLDSVATMSSSPAFAFTSMGGSYRDWGPGTGGWAGQVSHCRLEERVHAARIRHRYRHPHGVGRRVDRGGSGHEPICRRGRIACQPRGAGEGHGAAHGERSRGSQALRPPVSGVWLERIARDRRPWRLGRQQLRPQRHGHWHRRDGARRRDWPARLGHALRLRQCGPRRRRQCGRGSRAHEPVRGPRGERADAPSGQGSGAPLPARPLDGRRHRARRGRDPGHALRRRRHRGWGGRRSAYAHGTSGAARRVVAGHRSEVPSGAAGNRPQSDGVRRGHRHPRGCSPPVALHGDGRGARRRQCEPCRLLHRRARTRPAWCRCQRSRSQARGTTS